MKEPEQEKNGSSNMEMNIETPSKKRRRLSEESQEKMLTIKEKDKKIIIEYETKALSKLCSETEDQKIRKFIECSQQNEEGEIRLLVFLSRKKKSYCHLHLPSLNCWSIGN